MFRDFCIPPEGIDLYIFRRTNDVEKLKLAFQTKETPVFFRIGHGLKGNAVNFGFPELQSLGENLENVSKNNDWELAKELIIQLETWCCEKAKNRPSH